MNSVLRELRSVRFRGYDVPPKFRDFFTIQVFPLIKAKFRPNARKMEARSELALQIIQNLVLTGKLARVVADSRSIRGPGDRLRVACWDAILDAKLATHFPGSESSRMVTRYYATDVLLNWFDGWKQADLLNLSQARNSQLGTPVEDSLVIWHTGTIDLQTGKRLLPGERRKPIPFTTDGGRFMSRFLRQEDQVERVNRNSLKHTWTVRIKDPISGKIRTEQISVCLQQRHAGRPGRGMRLYTFGPSGAQGLRKAQRRRIRIDGERTIEFDYSGFVTRLLYHQIRIDPDPAQDIYKVGVILPRFWKSVSVTDEQRRIVRDFIKKATNTCWNVRARGRANSSLGKLLSEAKHRDFLSMLIYRTERMQSSNEIIDRIVQAHPQLADSFFADVGMRCMRDEAQTMLKILTSFADAEKPALGIHDGLICKRSDAEFAKHVMTEVYREKFGFAPLISDPRVSHAR